MHGKNGQAVSAQYNVTRTQTLLESVVIILTLEYQPFVSYIRTYMHAVWNEQVCTWGRHAGASGCTYICGGGGGHKLCISLYGL